MNDYPNDWLCAQHEAVHALLAHLLGGEVLEVTLRRTTYVEPRDYHDRLLITLAGWALSPEGTGADLDAALSLYQRWQSLRPVPLAPFHVCLPQWLAECRTWLNEFHREHAAIREALLERSYLRGATVRLLIDGSPPAPRPARVGGGIVPARSGEPGGLRG